MQPKRGGSEQIGHHAEQVAVAAAVMQDGLDADLAFDKHGGRLGGHTRLGTRAVGDIYAVNSCVFQQANRIKRFLRVTALWRQYFDRSDKFATSDLRRPTRTLLSRHDLYVFRR